MVLKLFGKKKSPDFTTLLQKAFQGQHCSMASKAATCDTGNVCNSCVHFPLPVHLPADGLRRGVKESPSIWDSAAHMVGPGETPGPGFVLAEPWTLQPSG